MVELTLPSPDHNGIINALPSKLSEENQNIRNTFGRHVFFFNFVQKNIVLPLFHKANPRRHKEVLIGLVSSIKSSRVLDIACGAGGAIEYFDKSNEYTGLDLSYPMLVQSVKRARKKKFASYRIVAGNAEELLFEDEAFDFVLMETALHMIPNHKDAISEIARVLTKGGALVCAVPTIGINKKFDVNWKKKADKYSLHPLTVDDIQTLCSCNGLNYTQCGTNGSMLYFQAHKELS